MHRLVTRKFPVVAMLREDFFDLKLLAKHVTNHHTPVFSTACQLIVDIAYPEGFYIMKDNCTKARVMKGRGRYLRKAFDLSQVALSLRHNNVRILTK